MPALRTQPPFLPSKIKILSRALLSKLGFDITDRRSNRIQDSIEDTVRGYETDITEYLSEQLIQNKLIRMDMNQPIVTQRALQSFMLRKLKCWGVNGT